MSRSCAICLPLVVAAAIAGCAAQATPSHLGGARAAGEGQAHAQAARHDGRVTDVTVDSRYGHGTVSGPVRQGRRNLEVRLPGGTWIDCARNCAETLRRESVDFWESRGGRNDGVDGPGHFSWFW